MGWIQEHLRQTSEKSGNQPTSENQFSSAARARWLALGEELRADVAEFNAHGSGADLTTVSEN
ncbi:MAG TPA: hypothetical protein VKV30_04710, partial [Candidatus Angelobacter sp.]|nr:hypothetical protein [Candidatus Angelobacter sp.]